MSKVCTVFFLLLACAPALAITNIESQRPVPPQEGWSGRVELTADGKSGNVNEDRFGVGGRLVYKAQENTFFTILTKSRSETQGLKTADQTFAHARWIHEQSQRTALEGFVQWQEDEFSNLLSRYLAGGGGRFNVLMEPEVYSLILGLGSFREWERSDLGTFIQQENSWRLNAYWAYKHQLNPQVNWYNTVYVQPSLESSSDYRLLFETGLAVRLTNALSLRLHYNLRHDSQPPQNLDAMPAIITRRTNTQYSTGFIYQF